ncbi:MAG: DUF5615 family PIN-like protein [Pyrinomonadaceae bacterium]
MSVFLYMDVHVPKAITVGLRVRGVNVLTAQEDATDRLPDSELLDRATHLQRVLFTFDNDLLVEATRRQRHGISFSGVIYARPLKTTIGDCIHDLELIAKAGDHADLFNRTFFLPL